MNVELWSALAGAGAAAAAVVAVISVIVAARANGKADDANELSAQANEIALAALPVPRIVLEAGIHPEKDDHVIIYNVGDTKFYGAQLTFITNGISDEEEMMKIQRHDLEPSAGFGFHLKRLNNNAPIKIHITGEEQRGSQRFTRNVVVTIV